MPTEVVPSPVAMPHMTAEPGARTEQFVFPPVSKDHIQNCSYDAWFPLYRNSCLKSRIIRLPEEFVAYLHEDGIMLADDEGGPGEEEEGDDSDEEWHTESALHVRAPEANENSSDEEDEESEEDAESKRPPNLRFPETHLLIKKTIADLGGAVVPKLNWSSPKDAKWISPHQNTLKCTSPNDIYLLLKSSSFVSHDLAHAFDGCSSTPPTRPFAPILVLRPFFTPHVALEFRCFVKHRALVGISQRDANYYGFLHDLGPRIQKKIEGFFRETLRLTFPDACFTFDVYIPEDSFSRDGLGRVRLVDINPWAPRTDGLLFSWQELAEMEVEHPLYGSVGVHDASDEGATGGAEDTSAADSDDGAGAGEGPKLRLVARDDPGAYNFSTAEYSAHKLPTEVVEASMSGEGGLREFAQRWKEMTEGRGGDMWEQPPPSSSR